MGMKRVLFIEDTPECQLILQNILKDYQLTICNSLMDAKEALKTGPFEAIILDIELPDGDGLRFLAEIPESQKNQSAIFIISSKTALANKAMAFTYGADDFIAKPFDPIELKMRVDAKIRKMHDQAQQTANFTIEDLLVNVAEQRLYHEVSGKTTHINFTSLEFRIFTFLSKNKNKVISRDEIINHIWGGRVYITDRTVDAHIAHIRKKIQASRVKIETVFGTGYKLTASSL
ncbi:response regulator transcription factor [Bdellovibrio sp. HCB337]|uniref:response regulator transcription factor n=1 Tax=Bdellovibrio sp. HCB337 TaxID=3394358 RepID=UPI0039A5B2CD